MTAPVRTKSADALVTEAYRLKDPLLRLDRIAEARRALADTTARTNGATADAISAARAAGATWPAIGERLNISAQRAQQLEQKAV